MSEENTKQTITSGGDDHVWEKSFIEKLALAGVTEQRRARRWGIFFKLAMMTYLVVLLVISMGPRLNIGMQSIEKHTAVVDVSGMIMQGTDASAANIIQGLRAAAELTARCFCAASKACAPNTKTLWLCKTTPLPRFEHKTLLVSRDLIWANQL